MIGPLPHGAPFLTSFTFAATPTAPGVRLRSSDGTLVIPRSTSGIVDMGGTTRARMITPPSVDDLYLPLWDDNNGTPYPDEAVWVSSILSDILAAAASGGGGGGGLSGAPIVLPAGGVSPIVTQSFFIKRGDNEPLIYQVTELDATGTPRVVDVTGWTGNFKLRATPDVGTILIDRPFYISDTDGNVTTDGTAGLLAYDWGRTASPPRTGETDILGLRLAEFETHRPSGVKKTYPTTTDQANNREYITVWFVADLDDAGSH